VFKTTAVSFHRCARQVVVAKISTVYAKPLGLGLGLGRGGGGGDDNQYQAPLELSQHD
jgi:hypothetical protein